ncbi:MAG: ATP-binding protein, partial [Caldilineaceae bacterium]|nr:ATP-binding protein [Caldilineaceae bacterium]
EVLEAHADTFTVIASIPARLELQGVEPHLSTITRSLLFTIAHNALTNAFRHSDAESVTISLEFGEENLRMSVSDDGTGLPDDYAVRGRGFRNMEADAERMGGSLHVESNDNGTTVRCIVPN